METFNAYTWFVDTMKVLQVVVAVGVPFAGVFYAGYVCGARRRVTKVWNVQTGSFPVMPGATLHVHHDAGK